MGKNKRDRECSRESDKKRTKKRKHREKGKNKSSESSDNSEESGWIINNIDQKCLTSKKERDDWMTSDEKFSLPTYTKQKVEKKIENEAYDPATSTRELNPYFRTGEGGLPSSSFRRPIDDDAEEMFRSSGGNSSFWSYKKNNWKKTSYEKETISKSLVSTSKCSQSEDLTTEFRENVEDLSVIQLNELGAKMLKAELAGNSKLAEKLRLRLERARKCTEVRNMEPQAKKQVLLSLPTSSGMTRPIKESIIKTKCTHERKKGRKIDTHESGDRIKYYPDDGKYDIKQLFEKEKLSDGKSNEMEFAKAMSKVKMSKHEDMTDIFSDVIRKDNQKDNIDVVEAMKEAKTMEKALTTCYRCFDSPKMNKDLIVYVGKTIYLSITYHEPLTPHHLVLSTIQHVPCTTMIDEDIWEELKSLKGTMTKWFLDHGEDLISFEIVKYLNRRPHMEMHLIASKKFEMIQFYFKKAIQESESFTMNKKLIEIKNDKTIRSSIPRGLPYFWIDFGKTGMAHVIENQDKFPTNFAEEIIGGMLTLDVNFWRKPKKAKLQPTKRVNYFKSMLKDVFTDI